MAVRRVESRLPPNKTAADLGQVSVEKLGPAGERFILVSYLTSPVPEKTKLDYVVFALPPTGSNQDVDVDRYVWTVTSMANPTVPVAESIEEVGTFHWTAQAVGQYKIGVELQLGGNVQPTVLATLELTQRVKARDAQLETLIKKTRTKKTNSTQADAQRELINDLRGYIVDAAQETGQYGIPARFLAAVLFMEIWARPKEGTANAKSYRKRAGGKTNPTWSEWTWDEIRQKVGLKREFGHIDDIRCVETELVADIFDDEYNDRRMLSGEKSIGIGQIAMTTAAMALGLIEWRDKPVNGSFKVNSEIRRDWWELGIDTQVDIFNLLRSPKTNIKVAALLLTRLKNRPNLPPSEAQLKRWPDLTAAQFWQDAKAVGVIATEYNKGATDSDREHAQPNKDNGRRAPKYVKDRSEIFPNIYFR